MAQTEFTELVMSKQPGCYLDVDKFRIIEMDLIKVLPEAAQKKLELKAQPTWIDPMLRIIYLASPRHDETFGTDMPITAIC